MTKKQEFIEFIDKLMPQEIPENVKIYWEVFKNSEINVNKPLFTETGKTILKLLQDNPQIPTWRAKDIAEKLFITSRVVSGSIRKLVTDGFVEKIGQEPTIYSITEKGKKIDIENQGEE